METAAFDSRLSTRQKPITSSTTSIEEEKQVTLMCGSHTWVHIRITWERKCLGPRPCPRPVWSLGVGQHRATAPRAPLPPPGTRFSQCLEMILFYRILTPRVTLCLRLQHTLERKGLEIHHSLLRARARVGLLRAQDSQPWSPPSRIWGYRQTWI